MTSPYIGEVRMFGGNFAPVNWALCNGQQLAISQYDALYALIGTTYGGDGQTTFNLPNLQGRLAIGTGQGTGLSNYVIGQLGGEEQVTLTSQTMASHFHTLQASQNPANSNLPGGNLTGLGATSPSVGKIYNTGSPPQKGNMNVQTVSYVGGSQPHDNLMPSLCVSFIIALYGLFPSQS
jgi:microcystin-dependent protein